MTHTSSIGELFDEIGFRRTAVDGAAMAWELPVAPHVINTAGGLQGGLLATLVDIVAGRLALDVCEDGSVVTSDMHLRYLRPVTAGAAQATARIVHAGKRSVIIDVEITSQPAGELAAIATINFVRVRGTSPLAALDAAASRQPQFG